MRHGNHNRKLGRERNQRLSLKRTLAEGLLKHGRIETTAARAKELRPYVEKLITRARENTLASRRKLISQLGTVARAQKLIKDVAPRYVDRAGGYTRIIKLPARRSDASPRALIELL